jgi:hypothetical protein
MLLGGAVMFVIVLGVRDMCDEGYIISSTGLHLTRPHVPPLTKTQKGGATF